MKIIVSIELFVHLLARDLPQKSKTAGLTLYSLDLYQGALLSTSTKALLQACLHEASLIEIHFSEKEMLRYHKEFACCDQRRCLTIEEYVAVEYAKEEHCTLLVDSVWLNRYAVGKGVEVMGFKEFENRCEQQRKLDSSRQERLRSYFAGQEKKNPQEEPIQQFIDDDTTV